LPIAAIPDSDTWSDDNLAAAQLQLSQSDVREIDDAFASIDIKGAALSEALDAAIVR
jgi:hypothetical protein